MSVLKRQGSPYYQVEFVYNGRRFRENTKLRDEAAAKQYEIDLRRRIATKTFQDEDVRSMRLNEISEEYTDALETLHVLSDYWAEISPAKEAALNKVAENLCKLDAALQDAAKMDYAPIQGKYWPSQEGWYHGSEYDDTVLPGVRQQEYQCCNCGVWFCAITVNVKKGEIEREIHYRGYVLGSDHRRNYCFPVCSEDCDLQLSRKVKIHMDRRMEEWNTIQQCKQLLREARLLLKNRQEVSQSPSEESKQEMTSQA